MRALLLVIALQIGAIATAEDTVYEFKLAGTVVGLNTYHKDPNGDFVSTSSLKLGPNQTDSKLTGHWKGTQLASFELSESSGPTKGKIKWDGSKIWSELNGKPQAKGVAVKLKSSAFFENWHPGIFSTLLTERMKNPKPEMEVVIVNGMAPVKCKFDVTSSSQTPEGKPAGVIRLKGDFANIGMELAFEGGECIGTNVTAQQFSVVKKGKETVFADPLAKYPELSQPTHKTKTETRLRAKMRDGVELVADISRPAEEGKYPVILIRTPYGRANSLMTAGMYVERGYVVVAQDVRGRGASGGGWDPFNAEVADGKDTLDWLVKQPWCDGNIGMIGGSYLGSVQWAAAVTHHPALKCIIPQVSPPEPTMNVPWYNGAFLLSGSLWWSRIVIEREANMAMATAPIENMKALLTLPLTKIDDKMLGKDVPFYNTWLKRANQADWKGAYTTQQVSQVKIPVMHVSGVWDGDGIGTMAHWEALRKAGGNQWLVFGPWEHGFNMKTRFGDQDYGPGSVLELDSVYLRFFDTYLKAKSVGQEIQPRVRFFVAGKNEWVTGDNWPLPSSRKVTWNLDGGPTSAPDDGMLVEKGRSGIDHFDYDPRAAKIVKDDAQVDSAKATTTVKVSDVKGVGLTYKTAPFTKDTTLAGPMQAQLYVSTTARDATFFVQLFDQGTDGKMMIIAQPGAKRVGFVNGALNPISPNKIYKIDIEPWLFARTFKKGHRFVVLVRSDMFPAYARNPGTGESDLTAVRMVKASQSVYWGAKYPSTVTLWQLP